jgi:UDP-N-acetylmuramyl pentapeptide phosphotransferase/UDP-N-acetylglucosamine-1-phosphate transferase
MIFLIFAFFLSLLITLGLIRYQHLHEKISSDHDLSGPQKFHAFAVPRIGGIGIFLSLLITGLIAHVLLDLDKGHLALQLIVCSLPAFLVGLLEDITKKIGVKTRLIATAISAGLVGYLLNAWVVSIQVPGIDWLLGIGAISIIFTIVGITGLANAYNIIDGFNGLASMVAIIALTAIGIVGLWVNDQTIAHGALWMIAAILGFFIWNYPKGLIFLGDGVNIYKEYILEYLNYKNVLK